MGQRNGGLQFRVFRRDQVIANLVTGFEYFAGEQVCLAHGRA